VSEQLTITCDHCYERVSPAYRTKVRAGREVIARGLKLDLCYGCFEKYLGVPLGLLSEKLPLDDGDPLGSLRSSGGRGDGEQQ
jgi:hypothetical protein